MKKLILITGTFLIATFVYINLGLKVDNSITNDDIVAIESLSLSDVCSRKHLGGFTSEVKCLVAIQKAAQAIGTPICASKNDVIEPAEFIKRNYGCCFDRARLIEKSARYYGFETRRVFLIVPAYGASLTNVIPLRQGSHATSEILTKKGWLGVDSNHPFILKGQFDDPYTYRAALDSIDDFQMMAPMNFYVDNIDVIYGLYSRHGNFHGKNFPGPEFVMSELLWNW